MPPADHIESELGRLRDSQHALRGEMNGIKLETVKAVGEAKDEIMDRIGEMNADLTERITLTRVELAVIKTKATTLGAVAGFIAPVLMWLIDKLAKHQ